MFTVWTLSCAAAFISDDGDIRDRLSRNKFPTDSDGCFTFVSEGQEQVEQD
jgi:hypothetical protein